MGWFTDGGHDEDGNARHDAWFSGSSDNDNSSKGCAVLALALAGGIVAIAGGAIAGLAALVGGMMS